MRVSGGELKARVAYPAVLIGGALLAFAYPEPDVAPLAWVSLTPLLYCLEGAGWKRGAGLGFAFGISFFLVLIHWISIVGFLALALLVLLQAGFIGLFGSLWGGISRRLPHPAIAVLGPAVAWVGIAEYLRSVFPVRGFTWGQLAQSQHNVPHLLRVTGIGGSWLLAFALVIVNALVLLAAITFLRRTPERRWGRGVALVSGAVALLLIPFLIPGADPDGDPVRVAIVQGNVPRDQPASFEKELTILRNHARLTRELGGVDLIVWPESSVGIDPIRNEFVGRLVGGAAREAGAPMIVGGNLDLPDDRYQVMAFLVSSDGRFVDRYQKTHLVPFGEYVPARRFLDWIPALEQVPRDAVPASEAVVFDVAGGSVAPVISFEGDFGSLVRGRIAAGGRLLVIATNTSTWRSSWASAQHLAMAQLRAAENGVYVAHSAISGISAFVDPRGRVIARSDLWTPAVLEENVAFARHVTFYARTGDWVPLACLVGSALLLGAVWRRRRSDTVA